MESTADGTRMTWRDPHGRGPRRPILHPRLPAARTRQERFYDGIRAACARLRPRWEDRLNSLRIVVEEVPPHDPASWEHNAVALARVFPGRDGLVDQISFYRRPIEARVRTEQELGLAILDLLVEQLAELWNLDPTEIDPGYH